MAGGEGAVDQYSGFVIGLVVVADVLIEIGGEFADEQVGGRRRGCRSARDRAGRCGCTRVRRRRVLR